MMRCIVVSLLTLSVLDCATAADAPLALGPFHDAAGKMRARIEAPPHSLNRIVTWTLNLEDANGAPIADAPITIEGRVPGLARIMPTAPRMVASPSPGRYEIGGIKFDMAGRWRLTFSVQRDGRAEPIIVDVEVK